VAQVEYEDVWKQFATQGAPAVRGLSLDIADGELLVLLGPSGCGKTTALRMLAGLEEPDSGDIRIAGASVVGREPKDRDVALVFQSYALYPHLSARENIRYPLKLRKMARAEQEQRVDRVAGMLGIAHLLPRRPGQLSGGEQQRVALARAIVREPRVFLMDEPLSNLDAKLRVHTRTELKTLQRQLGTTMVFVTHDQAEAMSLATRIAILSAGELQQIGTPDEVYDHPTNVFVAEFIGSPPMNLIEVTRDGDMLVAAGGWRLPLPQTSESSSNGLTLGLRPESIVIGEAGQPAEVVAVEPLGSEVIVDVRVGGKAVKVRAAPTLRPQPGSTVRITAVAGGIRLFDRSTGIALH
jgi:multiple sugar transport system ATP-binding protein